MQFISTSILFLALVFSSYQNGYGQNAQINHPLSTLFQKGVQDLKQGDTIAGFQNIQSAYTFSSYQEDVSYYYFSLSLILDKPNAAVAASKWLDETKNKIYHSSFKYYKTQFKLI